MKLLTRIAERRRQKARERHLLERERQRALGEQDVQEAIRGTAQGSAASQQGMYGQN